MLRETLLRFSLTRISRIRYGLIEYEGRIHRLRARSRKRVEQYNHQINTKLQQMRILTGLKAIILVLLYASFLSALFSNSVLNVAISVAVAVSGLVGSTLFFLAYAALSRLTNVLVAECQVLAAKIVAIVESENAMPKPKRN